MSKEQSHLIRLLTEALAEAKQGKVRSALLVTMKDNGGVGYGASINSHEDGLAAPDHLKTMMSHVQEMQHQVLGKAT